MKTIVAGSRSMTDYRVLQDAIKQLPWIPTAIISGAARGVDRLGECYAEQKDIPLEQFPADWSRHGGRAGYLRNVQMAESAEACLVLWDGHSRGAKMMMDIARRKGLPLVVWYETSTGWRKMEWNT